MKVSFILITTILLLVEGSSLGGAPSRPTCGAKTSSKRIEFINPAHPPNRCVYRVKAYSKSTYQLRVDFKMTLAEPTLPNATNQFTYPECDIDYVTIGELKLCGIETSQHLYVPFLPNSNEIEIVFVTSQRLTEEGLPPLMWDLMVHQLEWSDLSMEPKLNDSTTSHLLKKKPPPAAPIGCMQYFTHNSGIITSFNYNSGWGIYPNNMNYAICIQRKLQTTALKIKMRNFKIGSKHSTQVGFDNDCYTRNETNNSESFSGDYLMIPQAAIANSGTRIAYVCGYSLSDITILSTNPGPLMMVFNSDSIFKEGTSKQGFSLTYSLI